MRCPICDVVVLAVNYSIHMSSRHGVSDVDMEDDEVEEKASISKRSNKHNSDTKGGDYRCDFCDGALTFNSFVDYYGHMVSC